MSVSNEQLWEEQEEADWIDRVVKLGGMLGKASANPMRDSESSIRFQICAFNGCDLVSHPSVLPRVEVTLSREALTADPEGAGEHADSSSRLGDTRKWFCQPGWVTIIQAEGIWHHVKGLRWMLITSAALGVCLFSPRCPPFYWGDGLLSLRLPRQSPYCCLFVAWEVWGCHLSHHKVRVSVL